MFDLKEKEAMQTMTWEKLMVLEPRLEGLLAEVQSSRPQRKRGFHYETEWGKFKDPIANLIGWHRRDECDAILKTTAAYDVVYSKLYHALHD